MQVRLAEIRAAQGRTLEDIAGDLGMAISTVQRYEKQKVSIPSEQLPAVARAYRCRINDIFAQEDADGLPAPLPPEVSRLWQRMTQDRQAAALAALRAWAGDAEAG